MRLNIKQLNQAGFEVHVEKSHIDIIPHEWDEELIGKINNAIDGYSLTQRQMDELVESTMESMTWHQIRNATS
jgi:hypothetical protein